MNLETANDTKISKLYVDIKELVEQSRNRVYKIINDNKERLKEDYYKILK